MFMDITSEPSEGIGTAVRCKETSGVLQHSIAGESVAELDVDLKLVFWTYK